MCKCCRHHWQVNRQFVYGGQYIDEPLLFDRNDDPETDNDCTEAGDTRYLYCQNANYNVMALTVDNATTVETYRYDPYGECTVVIDDSSQNPYRFQGQRYDSETGLYYFKNRYYWPKLGRFGQPDPVEDVSNGNSYIAFGCSPASLVDSYGLQAGTAADANAGTTARCCGPDVTEPLKAAMSALRARFRGWTPKQMRQACEGLTSWAKDPARGGQPAFLNAWDIDRLWRGGQTWINTPPYCPPCAIPKGVIAGCESSVQVQKGCWYAGTVNYVTFGVMSRLCFSVDPKRWNKKWMEDLIERYKSGKYWWIGFGAGANYWSSLDWAKAGYDGWPRAGTTPVTADRPTCKTVCKVPYGRGGEGPFRVYWYPHGWK